MLGLGRHRVYKELRPFLKVQGSQLHHPVLLRAIGHVDPLVDGQPGNLPVLVVAVGPDGADPVRGKGNALRVMMIDFLVNFFCFHAVFLSMVSCKRKRAARQKQECSRRTVR